MPDVVRCSTCGLEIDEKIKRAACPTCGSDARTHAAGVADGIKILTAMTARGFHDGMSRTEGWFIRTDCRQVPQRSRDNAIANVERIFDRTGDRYIEKVTMCDSGEVIHSTNEPLSAHKGHGSDKPRKT
jgi:hypothetical protein